MTTSFSALLIALPEGIIDLGWGHPSPRLHPLATETLLPLAHQAGVRYRPGEVFSVARVFPHAMRLSFALYEIEVLVQGAERLGHALATYRHANGAPR